MSGALRSGVVVWIMSTDELANAIPGDMVQSIRGLPSAKLVGELSGRRGTSQRMGDVVRPRVSNLLVRV